MNFASQRAELSLPLDLIGDPQAPSKLEYLVIRQRHPVYATEALTVSGYPGLVNLRGPYAQQRFSIGFFVFAIGHWCRDYRKSIFCNN